MVDPVHLADFKKKYPILKDVSDDQFMYRGGKWFISSKALKQLAFRLKNVEFIEFINHIQNEVMK